MNQHTSGAAAREAIVREVRTEANRRRGYLTMSVIWKLILTTAASVWLAFAVMLAFTAMHSAWPSVRPLGYLDVLALVATGVGVFGSVVALLAALTFKIKPYQRRSR